MKDPFAQLSPLHPSPAGGLLPPAHPFLFLGTYQARPLNLALGFVVFTGLTIISCPFYS